MKSSGVEIESVDLKKQRPGIVRPGDRILRVDGRPVRDELDFRFYSAGDWMELEVQPCGKGGRRRLRVSRQDALALSFAPMRPERCRNRCIFCFVDQLPQGLRPSLYVKDEDFRFSFLYGNFVTLASLTDCDLHRILEQKLQPQYVSVHATDERVRNLLLGRRTSRNILETIRVLAAGSIVMHTQVVVCPGINDGDVLVRTLEDLAGFYPSVASIGVVPVGLTRYRNKRRLHPLRPVGKRDADRIVHIIEGMQRKFKVKYDDVLVFPSDEFYLKSGRDFPRWQIYGEFPQWENGVGMIPGFHRQWLEQKRRKRRMLRPAAAPRIAAVTGELAYPFLRGYVEWLGSFLGVPLRLIAIPNRFFGRQVGVAGLVTGGDLIRQVRTARTGEMILLVPDVMLSRSEGRLLDDVSLEDVQTELGMRAVRFRPDPPGLEAVLRETLGKD